MKASTLTLKENKPQIEGLKKRILNTFKRERVMNAWELRNLFTEKWEQVNRRLTDLENDGLIRQTTVVKKIGNRYFADYELTPSNEIETQKVVRYWELRTNWVMQGLNKGYITNEQVEKL